MCFTSLGWRHLVNAYGVKAGWFIPLVDKRVGGKLNCAIPLTRAISERIRGYDDALYKSTFTLLYRFLLTSLITSLYMKRQLNGIKYVV